MQHIIKNIKINANINYDYIKHNFIINLFNLPEEIYIAIDSALEDQFKITFSFFDESRNYNLTQLSTIIFTFWPPIQEFQDKNIIKFLNNYIVKIKNINFLLSLVIFFKSNKILDFKYSILLERKINDRMEY